MIRHKKANAHRLPKPQIENSALESNLPYQPVERPWVNKRRDTTMGNQSGNEENPLTERKVFGEIEMQVNGIFDDTLRHVKEKATPLFSGAKTFFPVSRAKGKENLYGKITDILRREECNLSQFSLNRTTPLIDRQKTSQNMARYPDEPSSSVAKGGATTTVLHLVRSSTPVEGERISTSRALMNYSKVYKRGPREQFKVRRDRSLMTRLGQVSAQKVVFQEKERPQRKELTTGWIKRRRSNTTRQAVASQEEDDFEIIGWEQFDD